MGGTDKEERDSGSFAIDIDDDLLAAALGAVERRAQPSARSFQDPVEDRPEARDRAAPDVSSDLEEQGVSALGHLGDTRGEDLDEDFEIEFDVPDFEREAQAVNESLTQQEQELKALSERVAELQEELTEVREERDKLALRANAFARERRRQQNHVRMVEDRVTRMEQSRQRLLDERDEAIQRFQGQERERERLVEDTARLRDRQRRDQMELRRNSAAPLVLEMLPAIDNLELAMEHAGANPERVIQGLEMILAQLHIGLQRGGVDRIHSPPGGAFDPEVHEAILEERDDAVEPGRISRVVSAGYRLNGRLLRPAKVVVSGSRAPQQRPRSEVDAGRRSESAPEDLNSADEATVGPGEADFSPSTPPASRHVSTHGDADAAEASGVTDPPLDAPSHDTHEAVLEGQQELS